MLQAFQDPDLLVEPLGAHRGGELGPQDLESHQRPAVPVPREEHDRHPAAVQLPLHLEPVLERLSDAVNGERHA